MSSFRLRLSSAHLVIGLVCLLLSPVGLSAEAENEIQIQEDLRELALTPMKVTQVWDGQEIVDEVIVDGKPPVVYRAAGIVISKTSDATATAVLLSNVPAFNWTYGCSATSAGMMMGYYDNNGYPNMYTGPSNGGVCPLNNQTFWSNTTWPSVTCGECPLVASHQGVDGRVEFGHVDDYWVDFGSSGTDPFVTGGWSEHSPSDCTADFMGTNQDYFNNSDGSTRFYYNPSGAPLYDYLGSNASDRDGCHGMKLFVESRGYSVDENFSQYIMGYDGNTAGFTFNDFKAEIDAGRPVMIHVTGHTMLAYGYDGTDTMYIHDTWDHNEHSMTWGGSYSGADHYGVTVIRLSPVLPIVTSVSPDADDGGGDVSVTLSGYNFVTGASVKLVRSGYADIIASSVNVSDASTITCTFTLTGDLNGVWHVVVTNPGGASGVLTDGFMIGHQIFSENMDTDPGWTISGGEWEWGEPLGVSGDPNSGHTGNNVYGYDLAGTYANRISATYWLTTTAIDCSGYENVSLVFYRWLGVESASNDHAYISVSNDGSVWEEIWSNSSISNTIDTAWSAQTFDISAYADGQSTVYIRWGMGTTDNRNAYCGWNIDDVYVLGDSVAPHPGDANLDGAVDVGDLGILAANYGMTSGAVWAFGDFNADGAVDVGDLGILAANYGFGSSGSSDLDFDADREKVFAEVEAREAELSASSDGSVAANFSTCSSLGLSMIAGLCFASCMLVKTRD